MTNPIGARAWAELRARDRPGGGGKLANADASGLGPAVWDAIADSMGLGSSVLLAYNGTGSSIAAGVIVSVTGAHTVDGVVYPTVAVADAGTMADTDALAVTDEELADGTTGLLRTAGLSAGTGPVVSAGTPLYIGSAGAFSATGTRQAGVGLGGGRVFVQVAGGSSGATWVNAAPGATVANSSAVVASGIQGPAGPTGASGSNQDVVVTTYTQLEATLDSGATYAGKTIYVIPGAYTAASQGTKLYLWSGMSIEWGYGDQVTLDGYRIVSGNSTIANTVTGFINMSTSMPTVGSTRINTTTYAGWGTTTIPVISGSWTVGLYGMPYAVTTTVGTLSYFDVTTAPKNQIAANGTDQSTFLLIKDAITNVTMRGRLHLTGTNEATDTTPVLSLQGFGFDTSHLFLTADWYSMYSLAQANVGFIRYKVGNSIIGRTEVFGRSISTVITADTTNYIIEAAWCQNSHFMGLRVSDIRWTPSKASGSANASIVCVDARQQIKCHTRADIARVFSVSGGNIGTLTTYGFLCERSHRTLQHGSIEQIKSLSASTNTVVKVATGNSLACAQGDMLVDLA